MKNAPPLADGEEVLFDHLPSLRAYKRAALILVALTLPVVVVFAVIFPDSYWPAVPLFVTCLLLTQERVTLGRHRAWVTNQRIILQGARSVALADIGGVAHKGKSVHLAVAGKRGKGIKLHYSADPVALARAIEMAGKGIL